MRRPRPYLFLAFGILLLGGALWLGMNAGPVQAQGQSEADYVGADECAGCHKGLAQDHAESLHARALVDVSRNKKLIKADFSSGEDVRTLQFPEEAKARPIEANDIAFVIGAGRYIERYAFRITRTKFAILPVEWNVETKTWQPYLADQGMWPDAPAYDFAANCAGCHTTGLNAERGRWTDEGVQCEACHGPGSIHAELGSDARTNPTAEQLAALRGAITLTPDAQVCGQCHSQGKNTAGGWPYPAGYRPGLDLLAPEVFTLIASDDPAHWWPTGHGKSNNMQYNEWLNSRHARALDTLKSSAQTAPECLSCHSTDYRLTSLLIARQAAGDRFGDAPTLPGLDEAKNGVTCVGCHQPHNPAQPDFLLAASDSYTLCAGCHQATNLTETLHHPVREMFEGGTLIESVAGVPSAHFSAENGPRCQTCHVPDVPAGGLILSSHALKPVLPEAAKGILPDTCSGCHDTLTPEDLQSLIDEVQKAVSGRVTLAETRLSVVTAPEAGSQAAARYQDVVTALAFVKNDGSLGVHNYTYADALLTTAEAMISELSVPGATLQPTEGPRPTATPSDEDRIVFIGREPARTGLRPMTIISIGATLLTLLIGAFIFWRSARRRRV